MDLNSRSGRNIDQQKPLEKAAMTRRRLLGAAMVSAMLLAQVAVAAKPPPTWDGLVLVKSKRLDLVYLQPGADFRGYSKVMLDPTEVAFQKNWKRDHNSSTSSLSSRVSDRDMQKAISEGVTAASDIFNETWSKAGYQVVQAPGPDVLRVKTGIINVTVNAPDMPSAGRSYSFADEAGSATLFIEARDSMTGALLGRAVDQRIAGDNTIGQRNRATNRGDFRDLVEEWAAISVRGMTELKTLSPVQP
jgi:hypothetical protein